MNRKPLVESAIGLLMVATAALAAVPAAAHDEASGMSPRAQAMLGDARRATASFHDLRAAQGAGYGPLPFADAQGLTCIAHATLGAMGIHYVNGGLLDATVDALTPEALIYEPMPGGTLRLVGAEYIVFESVWQGAQPPRLFDQAFHLVPAGNRYGLPPFYALHVWLWQPNRSGLFADWNPAVRCP